MTFLLQTNTLFNLADLRLIAPELILTTIACLALVIEVVLPYKLSKWTAWPLGLRHWSRRSLTCTAADWFGSIHW